MPTHSIPLTGAASAHSPLRMCISAWLIPNAFTSITAYPGLGSGSAISLITKCSTPPNPSMTIARIRHLQGIEIANAITGLTAPGFRWKVNQEFDRESRQLQAQSLDNGFPE